MKITYANRPNWSRVLSKRFYLEYITDDNFSGFVSVILIDKVKEPLYVSTSKEPCCIVDNGYIWLQHFPDNANYALTTMFNPDKEIIQWYFDICDGNKVDPSGMPYFIDLYLDIVVQPSGEITLLDEDDLQEALNKQEISQEKYEFASNEAHKLMAKLKVKHPALVECTRKHFEYMLADR